MRLSPWTRTSCASSDGGLVGHQRNVRERGGEHLAADPQHAPGFEHASVEAPGHAGQRGDEQVAEGVPLQIAAVHESILEELREQVLVIREGGQAVAHIARRRKAEVATQSTGRTAVVGDGHDGGQVGRVFLEASQQRRQAIAAAEGDDLGSPAQPAMLGNRVDHRFSGANVRRQQRAVQAEEAEKQEGQPGGAEQNRPSPSEAVPSG